MKKRYFLIAFSIIAFIVNTSAMNPDRHSLFTLIDTFIGNIALGESSNWQGIFSILEKLASDKNTVPFTVNEYFSQQGHTLLCLAVEDNDFLAVKILLEKFKANPNGKSAWTGMTPLMFACKDGYTDIVVLLLQHGADPLIQNSYGKNSFFFAETYAKYNIMKDDTVLRILKTYKR